MNKFHAEANCIEKLETLLNQIDDFKKLTKINNHSSDPAILQEYRLFKQYIEWQSEDLLTTSQICNHYKQH